MKLFFAALLLSAATARLDVLPQASPGGGTTCIVCVLLLTLVEQLADPTKAPTGPNPEAVCKDLTFCDGTCTLFNGTWVRLLRPVNKGAPASPRPRARNARPPPPPARPHTARVLARVPHGRRRD